MESALLLTSFGRFEAAPSASEARAAPLVELVARGAYLEALGTSAAQALLSPEEAPATAEAHYAAIRSTIVKALEGATSDEQLLVLTVGVAAFYAAVQANVTGPALEPESQCPSQSVEASVASEWNMWALSALRVDGEDIGGKLWLPQYLLVARVFLLESGLAGLAEETGTSEVPMTLSAALREPASPVTTTTLPTAPWWAARCALLHHRLLSARTQTLRVTLLRLHSKILRAFAPTTTTVDEGGSGEGSQAPGALGPWVGAMAHLETAVMEHEFGHTGTASRQLAAACARARVSVSVTGAMGYRTVHQQDAKAQMVAVVEKLAGDKDDEEEEDERALRWEEGQPVGLEAEPEGPNLLQEGVKGLKGSELDGMEDTSDVHAVPRLAADQEGGACESSGAAPEGAAFARALSSLEQALVLAQSINIKKSEADDGLRSWRMAPFIEALRAQVQSRPTIRASAALLVSRHERGRSRVRERALLLLEALAEAHRRPDGAPAAARMHFAFSSWLPPLAALKKEYGEALVAFGAVAPALALFEEVELWDPLILCYQLLGKKTQAAAVVRQRLEITPDAPLLWCALGDSIGDLSCYEEAWKRSGGRSARAQRSLAKKAAERKDFAGACEHWELALAINPLHREGWFGLGFAAMKVGKSDVALRAFTRCTQLESEDPQAWNNIAAICLKQRKFQPAYVALQEAVKHTRSSFHIWDNLALVALQAGHSRHAAQALERVLTLAGPSKVDMIVLERLLTLAEEAGEKAEAAAAKEREEAEAQAAAAADAEDEDAPYDDEAAEAAAVRLSDALKAAAESGFEDDEDDEDGVDAAAVLAAAAPAAPLSARDAASVLELTEKVALAVGESGGAAGARGYHLLARAKRLRGETQGEAHFLQKAVRGLQSGTPWAKEAPAFEAYAEAVAKLCEANLAGAEAAAQDAAEEKRKEARRLLSAARMLLRGVMKQAEERFEETPAFANLQRILSAVTEREDRLKNE
mmetsp:Transcript_31280/g.102024  ORF Transcript_31280/g.102024 Transcript_31280/m.102024 type:complete len:986 (+) Transcript_31280:68-3025(+)